MDNSNEGGQALLERGQALLAAGERAGATAALIAARNLPATRRACCTRCSSSVQTAPNDF